MYKAIIMPSVEIHRCVCVMRRNSIKCKSRQIDFKHSKFLTVLEMVKLLNNIGFHKWKILVKISKASTKGMVKNQ